MTNSRLLGLPCELRCQIWENVVYCASEDLVKSLRTICHQVNDELFLALTNRVVVVNLLISHWRTLDPWLRFDVFSKLEDSDDLGRLRSSWVMSCLEDPKVAIFRQIVNKRPLHISINLPSKSQPQQAALAVFWTQIREAARFLAKLGPGSKDIWFDLRKEGNGQLRPWPRLSYGQLFKIRGREPQYLSTLALGALVEPFFNVHLNGRSVTQSRMRLGESHFSWSYEIPSVDERIDAQHRAVDAEKEALAIIQAAAIRPAQYPWSLKAKRCLTLSQQGLLDLRWRVRDFSKYIDFIIDTAHGKAVDMLRLRRFAAYPDSNRNALCGVPQEQLVLEAMQDELEQHRARKAMWNLLHPLRRRAAQQSNDFSWLSGITDDDLDAAEPVSIRSVGLDKWLQLYPEGIPPLDDLAHLCSPSIGSKLRFSHVKFKWIEEDG